MPSSKDKLSKIIEARNLINKALSTQNLTPDQQAELQQFDQRLKQQFEETQRKMILDEVALHLLSKEPSSIWAEGMKWGSGPPTNQNQSPPRMGIRSFLTNPTIQDRMKIEPQDILKRSFDPRNDRL